MQKRKKDLIWFGGIAAFPILWAVLWQFALSNIPILARWLFDYEGIWFGAWIASAACAVLALTRAGTRRMSIILSLVFLAIWLYPSVATHYNLMSWQGLYDYDWVQRLNLVPFRGKPVVFFTSVLFPFATMYDAPRNMMMMLIIGLLIAGTRHKAVWFGTLTAGCVLIELAQLATGIGCCDTNDVCYRVIGLAVGLEIGVLIAGKRKKAPAFSIGKTVPEV